ncbi:MAG TPA: DUF3006 domain-containing protein [Armatimonadota bacterium]|nr:DUF3006 domain-containing protein [Armatimonadota bacterium]
MLRAYVESVHGESARVLIGDEAVAVSIPVHQLPPAAKEGTVLRLNMTIDQAATARMRGRAGESRP